MVINQRTRTFTTKFNEKKGWHVVTSIFVFTTSLMIQYCKSNPIFEFIFAYHWNRTSHRCRTQLKNCLFRVNGREEEQKSCKYVQNTISRLFLVYIIVYTNPQYVSEPIREVVSAFPANWYAFLLPCVPQWPETHISVTTCFHLGCLASPQSPLPIYSLSLPVLFFSAPLDCRIGQ